MTENSESHNLKTYHFLYEFGAILEIRNKKYYWLKINFILVFSLPLKASPGKNFFGPPPKKLLEKPFLGHFWLKIGYSCPDNFEKPR